MLPLIVRTALLDLVGAAPGTPEFELWVGRLFYVPAMAGGIFGLLGGYLTDLWGRRRVLVGSILLWWIYFDTGAQRGEHRLSHSGDPGRLARLGYTYLHLPIVAGILVCAVGDEITLLHPGHATAPDIAVLVGGPAVFLTGAMLFKWVTNVRRVPPLSHLSGLALLALGLVLAAIINFLIIAAICYFVLILPMQKLNEAHDRLRGVHPEEPAETDVDVLRDIRDLLREQQADANPTAPPATPAP